MVSNFFMLRNGDYVDAVYSYTFVVESSSQWLFNFVSRQSMPRVIASVEGRTSVVVAIFNYLIAVYIFFVASETKWKSS
jgi:hypothetical protein